MRRDGNLTDLNCTQNTRNGDNYFSSQINQGVYFLFVPIIVLLTYIFLECPQINDKIESYFETKFLSIAFKALILFLIAYLADRYVYSWRKNHRPPEIIKN